MFPLGNGVRAKGPEIEFPEIATACCCSVTCLSLLKENSHAVNKISGDNSEDDEEEEDIEDDEIEEEESITDCKSSTDSDDEENIEKNDGF